jgi:hypothetical protein
MSIHPVSGASQPSPPAVPFTHPSGPIGCPLARRDTDTRLTAEQITNQSEGGMTLLFRLQIIARDSQRQESIGAIVIKRNDVKLARQKLQEAIKRALEEAEKKASWAGTLGKLSTLAKVAGIVAGAAAIVASGGTLTAPVVIGLSGTLLSVSAKPVADAVGGGETMEKVLSYSGAGLSLVGGAWGAINALTGGVQAGCSTAQATSSFARTARVVALGANIGGGVANTVSAYALYQTGYHGSLEMEARADQTTIRARQRIFQREIEDLLQSIKGAEESFKRASTALIKAIDSGAASGLAIANLGGRS